MRKIATYVLIPLVVLLGIGLGGYYYIQSKIYKPTKQQAIFDNEEDQAQVKATEDKGITNILLIGLDGRTKDSDSRTDSMILATIDGENKRVKLASFMRDMYVPIPGHGQTRMNTAFFLGGPELLMKTMNQDFNTNVQYYVSIDFKAFQALVDKVGGVDVEVKEKELEQLNYYIKEANWHNPHYIKKAGYQHLDGQQALSYCRIRKVGNNDYERTERQRRVISVLITKMKNVSILKLPDLFTTLLPYIKTNMPTSKLMGLGYTVFSFGSINVDQMRVPADGMYKGAIIDGADVLVPDMAKNVALLDRFMSSTGALGTSDVPAYMDNNYHADDKSIDKRNTLRKVVTIKIPKNTKKSKQYDESRDKGQDAEGYVEAGDDSQDNPLLHTATP